ncbi:protein kinase family protein [Thermicanus aegyptius]|uniref:protein kinase family protein n=1 Tax=Thermicanus aegyptius TaxID=94009 RepID=UPI0003F5D812|nr:protein kinase family protein [Thermicanus aegyptius]
MNIENYIEAQYRELLSNSTTNAEFSELYAGVEHAKLREILATLHHDFISLFRMMNERLPTKDYEAHFWADPSRSLIKTIEITLGLYNALKNTKLAFEINEYYSGLIKKCRDFLSTSGGSTIPPHMDKIDLYYTIPLFTPNSIVTIDQPQTTRSFSLKQIGSGSYANVYKYWDTFYDKNFVLKRAKKDLTPKELERFRREFDEMKEFSSPYILEVYRYDEAKNEYIMEHMDYTLDSFIQKNNSSMATGLRKSIVNQILRAFEYIHSKDRLHRDISPKNILLKEYHDIHVVKITDFGLVKVPDSSLTTANTEFKGYFNDPSLVVEGFDTYNILHETYALTRIVYFVMTGKTNTDAIPNLKLREFVNKGLHPDKSMRFKTTTEMIQAFRTIS